jgi:predicted RNA-binding protein with TRAM domain
VRKLTGHVAAVNAKNGTVTVLRKGEGGLREDIVKLAPDARVIVDGKEAKLDAVPTGSTAEFSITALAKEGSGFAEVSEVAVDRSKIVWVVKEADAASVTLLGGGRKTQLPDQVIKLAPGAKVLINGKESKPTDLQPGDVATIVLNADRSAATSVAVKTRGGAGDGDRPVEKPGAKPRLFGGKIMAVDAAAGTITLAPKGEGGKEMVVRVTADAKITVDGKEVKLADVPKGVAVTFALASAKDGQLREVNEVTVAGPTFNGVVKQIDSATVTIGNEKNDRVLKLAAAGKVMIGEKGGKLADLKVGDRVSVTMTSDESAAALIVVGVKKPAGDRPKPDKENPDGDE